MHSFIVGDEGRLVGGGWCVPTKSDENRWSVKLPTISHNKITANKVLLRAGRKLLFVDKDNFLKTKSNLSCVMSMDLTDYFSSSNMSVPAEKYGLGMLIQQSCQPTPMGIIRLASLFKMYHYLSSTSSCNIYHVINITQSIEMSLKSSQT